MQYVKIQSEQGTSFNRSANLIDFRIPEYMGVVDLENCHINLNCQITTTDNPVPVGTDPGNGIYDVVPSINPLGQLVHNVSLYKQYSVAGSKVGQLESVLRADTFNDEQKYYTSDYGDELGIKYENASGYNNPWFRRGSIFRNLVSNGDANSSELTAPIMVRCKDLLGIGNKKLDLSKVGDLHIHLQARIGNLLDNLLIFNPQNDVFPEDFQAIGADATGVRSYIDVAITYQPPEVGPPPVPSQVNTLPYNDSRRFPFWNGEKIGLQLIDDMGSTVTNADGSPFDDDQEYLIRRIQRQEDGTNSPLVPGMVRLHLDRDAYDISAFAAPPAFTIVPLPLLGAELSVISAEMVVARMPGKLPQQMIEYNTIRTILDTMPISQNFSRVYELDPACQSVFIAILNDDPSDMTTSAIQNVVSYRFRVNGEDLTSRDIVLRDPLNTNNFRSPLHYLLLDGSFDAHGKELKNLSSAYIDKLPGVAFESVFTGNGEASGDGLPRGMFGCAIDTEDSRKLLEVSINLVDPASHPIAIYQSVRRMI